jgi:hypothetical protein
VYQVRGRAQCHDAAKLLAKHGRGWTGASGRNSSSGRAALAEPRRLPGLLPGLGTRSVYCIFSKLESSWRFIGKVSVHSIHICVHSPRGALLASAAIDSNGRVLPGLQIHSEAGTVCQLVSPWPENSHGSGGAAPLFTVETAVGVPVQVSTAAKVGPGITVYSFRTEAGTTYILRPAAGL